MTTPQDTIWEIEPHTLAKHEILRRYLGAWFPILGTYNPRIVYIDGFSGPGRYKGGEIGSPIIAIQEALKHSQRLHNNQLTFLFMDERADRIEHLKYELSQISTPANFYVVAQAGQFDCEFQKRLDALEAQGAKLAPTFAFIDPFGFRGLPFDLVRRLLMNSKTEVLINVMADSINRFLEHPDAQTRQHIVNLFGTSNVLQIAQQTGDRVTSLRLLYQQQLRKHARFVRYFEMRDKHGRTIYYLFFAGNHPLGHVKMKESFWRVDSSSGFSFSDATNPNQMVLFDTDETPKLAEMLQTKFVHQQVNVEQIKKFIEDESAFIATHMRSALRMLEDERKISVRDMKTDGKKRHANTYPENAVIEFK